MFRRLLLSSCLLTATLLACCQQANSSFHPPSTTSVFQKAESLYNSPTATDATDSLSLLMYLETIRRITRDGRPDSLLLQSWCKAGILYMLHGHSPDAMNAFRAAVKAQLQHPHLPDSLLFQPLLYTGSLHYELNDLDSAMWYYQRANDLLARHPAIPESERLYNKLGVLYYELGDYKKSIFYFSKALQIVQARQPQDTAFIVNYRNNIASALRKLGYTDSAIHIYKDLLLSGINTNDLRHNIGMTLLDQGSNAEALAWLQKIPYTPGKNISLSNHLALACLRMHRLAQADIYLSNAFTSHRNAGNHPHDFDHANSLWIAGDLAMQKNNPNSALRLYQSAILELVRDFKDTSVYANPGSFQRLSNSFVLFDILIAKARAFSALGNKDSRHALDTYDAALKFSRQLQLIYHSDEARFFLNDKVTPACQEAVHLAVSCLKTSPDPRLTEMLFTWCEGNKASVLQAALYSLQFESISGLPQQLLKETKAAKAILGRLNLNASLIHDSTALRDLDKRITGEAIRVAGLEQQLEQNKDFRRLMFASREYSLDSIRKNLVGPDEVCLSYYYTDRQLLCFYITAENSGLYTQVLPAQLINIISSYRGELDKGDAGYRDLTQKLSTGLFDLLLRPVHTWLKGKKHLVIIPYNALSYIPFESLIDAGQGRPILYDFAVSYRYSASQLTAKNRHAGDLSSFKVLGFAPFAHTGGNPDFPMLPASANEIGSLKGRLLYDSAATKENFITLSKEYSIIHLATHARASDADGLQSNIAFYHSAAGAAMPDLLYEQDIYNIDMQHTSLVILSACQTGGGQLINGEGIMSLSRAFSYAGCPAVITSIWRAEDEATSYISRRLHHYLSQGLPVDIALQKAKLDFLDDGNIPSRLKSPAFWAHMVLIGDPGPVAAGKKPWPLIALAICVLLLAGLIWYKSRGRHSPPGLAS